MSATRLELDPLARILMVATIFALVGIIVLYHVWMDRRARAESAAAAARRDSHREPICPLCLALIAPHDQVSGEGDALVHAACATSRAARPAPGRPPAGPRGASEAPDA